MWRMFVAATAHKRDIESEVPVADVAAEEAAPLSPDSADGPRSASRRVSHVGSITGHQRSSLSSTSHSSSSFEGVEAEDKDEVEDAELRAPRLLLQLLQRKWTRRYAVLFYRLMLQRTALVLIMLVATLLRASVPGVDSPDWRHCDNLSPTDYNACQASQFMVLVIAIFGWWLLLHHLLRLTLYWAWPRLRRALCDRRVGGLPPLPAREEVVYATIHGGNLGIFHLVTLLMGSGLLAVAASIDLAVGWSYAVNTYAVGGTFAIAHLLYYLVGFERTGPLVVMLGSSVATDYTRWM